MSSWLMPLCVFAQRNVITSYGHLRDLSNRAVSGRLRLCDVD